MFWGPDAYEPILEDTGAASGTTGYAADALDRYTSAGPATFGYDGRGNLVSDGTNSYGYDLHDRMTSASTSGGTTLSYDPLGRLWQVSSPAYGTTQFVYDGDHVAVEYDGDSGAVRRRLFWGPGADEPILEDTGGALDCSGTRFLHADERGRVTASADCWGHALQQNSYDEYGIPAPGNRGRFQYTGQAWLPELGLYYYKARMYSPTLGRFLQTDPIGYADGLDWYDYAHGDPVNFTDPLGLMRYHCDSHGHCTDSSGHPVDPKTKLNPGDTVTYGNGTYTEESGGNFTITRLLNAPGVRLNAVGNLPNDRDHGCPAGTTYKAMTPDGPNCQAPPVPMPPKPMNAPAEQNRKEYLCMWGGAVLGAGVGGAATLGVGALTGPVTGGIVGFTVGTQVGDSFAKGCSRN